ncbi:DUF6090 family protein [Balneola sp. MJW-20]|uniref:DUF6090 family protein n=1 Tax=Gracilimonas aurantiaca TaxID=3234185 RepID=UPI003465560B
MITLFRRIREKLIASGSLSKYLLYAMGEILLVMIGILLALQVNNWNEERKERIRESVLKEQLVEEFQRDMNQLRSKIKIRKQIISSSNTLLQYIIDPTGVSVDSIRYHLAVAGYRPTFDPISVEFIDKSDLLLIQNKELKRLLTAWKINVLQLNEDEQVWRNYVLDYRIPFFIENNVMNDISVEFRRNNSSSVFLIDGNMDTDKPEIPLVGDPGDFQGLIRDPFMEDFLSLAISVNTDNNDNSYALETRIQRILTLLKE